MAIGKDANKNLQGKMGMNNPQRLEGPPPSFCLCFWTHLAMYWTINAAAVDRFLHGPGPTSTVVV